MQMHILTHVHMSFHHSPMPSFFLHCEIEPRKLSRTSFKVEMGTTAQSPGEVSRSHQTPLSDPVLHSFSNVLFYPHYQGSKI